MPLGDGLESRGQRLLSLHVRKLKLNKVMGVTRSATTK